MRDIGFCKICGNAFIAGEKEDICPQCKKAGALPVENIAHAKTLSELETKFRHLESFVLSRIELFEKQLRKMDQAILTFQEITKKNQEKMENLSSEIKACQLDIYKIEESLKKRENL